MIFRNTGVMLMRLLPGMVRKRVVLRPVVGERYRILEA